MRKADRIAFVLAFVGSLWLARLSTAAERVQGHLVGAGWLEKNMNKTGVRIIDASPTQAYATSHIPGAISADIFLYGVAELPASAMEKRFQAWGVSPGMTIVIYDQGAAMQATRLFYSFVYYGFPAKDLFILDGGFFQWREKGLPAAKDPAPAPNPGSFKVTRLEPSVKAELHEILAATGDPAGSALLEALTADWHFGEIGVFDRPGHIPRGILFPSADFYNPDKTFKSPGEIGAMLAYLGVKPEQRIYTYCGGGVAASVPFFALKYILGAPQVKLYEGSEMDWLSDDRGLPYWTYDAPYLMREAGWLQAWGCNQMMRSVGVNRVSIVDVRPAEAFSQGHPPFALNIPGEVFRNHITDPDGLARILGAAGVDASHEAVIVSGGGLTKDAALAFVLLEALGQDKTSFLTDSMERWTKLGFSLTKNATAVGPKKAPNDVSIPPTDYPRNRPTGTIIADPRSSREVYPRVFLASGPELPSKPPEGKVVHVPYTNLLNDDGAPKPAKEIWSLLNKAGVPRYAELVCVSDEPGEAAANYVILKLMGFPKIRVLAAR